MPREFWLVVLLVRRFLIMSRVHPVYNMYIFILDVRNVKSVTQAAKAALLVTEHLASN